MTLTTDGDNARDTSTIHNIMYNNNKDYTNRTDTDTVLSLKLFIVE